MEAKRLANGALCDCSAFRCWDPQYNDYFKHPNHASTAYSDPSERSRSVEILCAREVQMSMQKRPLRPVGFRAQTLQD